MALPLGNMSRARGHNPANTRRNNNVIMTSNDVATSFRRHDDVIIASCARWVMGLSSLNDSAGAGGVDNCCFS